MNNEQKKTICDTLTFLRDNHFVNNAGATGQINGVLALLAEEIEEKKPEPAVEAKEDTDRRSEERDPGESEQRKAEDLKLPVLK